MGRGDPRAALIRFVISPMIVVVDEARFFAHFLTSQDDEAARSLRQLIDLPAAAEEVSAICKTEHLGAVLLDLEGRRVGHVDAEGNVTLTEPKP